MPTLKEIILCCIHSNAFANVSTPPQITMQNGMGGGEGPGEQYVDTLYDYVLSPLLKERTCKVRGLNQSYNAEISCSMYYFRASCFSCFI